MLVYLIVNRVNGKSYVGQTTQDLSARWRQHCLLQGKCRVLENAIRKYGSGAFEVSVVAAVHTQQELNRLERLTCEALKTYAPHGYNLREGGGAKGRMHEQTKQIIRDLALSPKRLTAFQAMRQRPDVQAKMQVSLVRNGPTAAARMNAGRTTESEVRRRASVTQAWRTERLRQAQSVLQREIQARPEVKAQKSASIAAYWASLTEEERAARGKRLSERLRGHKKNIDRSDVAKAKRSEIKRALWATPEHRAKMTAVNSDPEVLKRRGDAIRAGHARNKRVGGAT